MELAKREWNNFVVDELFHLKPVQRLEYRGDGIVFDFLTSPVLDLFQRLMNEN